MAQTATGRRNSHAARRKPTSSRRREATRATGKAKKAKELAPSRPGLGPLARSVARKAVKKVASKVADAGAQKLRSAGEQVAATAGQAVSATTERLESGGQRRLPIQSSIDVAVPVRVAWEEWMSLSFLPEGVHRVEGIERDGNELFGKTVGGHSKEWAAEILDERGQQSFAWQSTEGSDCAGLVTFHQLSQRLTRLELNLDVIPTSLPEVFALLTRIADRRAEADLRRFKARLELINPDLYEQDEEPQNDGPEDEQPQDEDTEPEDSE
jgi:uncharacterized membrane protein